MRITALTCVTCVKPENVSATCGYSRGITALDGERALTQMTATQKTALDFLSMITTDGPFRSARCECGWHGPSRLSYRRVRLDAASHARAHEPRD